MNNAAVRDWLARFALARSLIAISSAIAALFLFPLAAFAISYEPGQTLNPACLPTDPTCVVATSTFAGNITVAGTASSTNVVVSDTLTFGTLTGILKAVGGAVETALVNLATDVTGILPVANGGTGWANIAAGSILFGNGSSAVATSSNLYWDNTDGWLGIGTSTPGSPLSVAGNGYFTGSVNASEYQVGGSNFLTSLPGTYDIEVGSGALANLTAQGYWDTAVGDNALVDATSSTATGGNAGYSLTAVGHDAGFSTTIGFQDTIVGDKAFQNNTTGSNNVAIGDVAEYQNTSATSTVVIGAIAGYGTGSYHNQGGTYVGYGAGYDNTTGSDYDTLLGLQAGYGITTGSNNLILAAATSSTGINNITTGSQNILIGNNIGLPSATANGQLDIGNILYGTNITGTGSTLSTGNIGIGTTTPYARLSVWGADAASSTLAFAVVNSASTTVFSVFDGGNAELSGSLSQSSDERLKTNVASLDASSSLSLIDELNPVTFNWIDPDQGATLQLGFIAQQVQQIFPNLVSTTSATALTPDGTLSLNYIGLISPIVSAIQSIASISGDFENNLIAWLGNAQNGIGQLFANEIDTQKLCVGSTCVTPAQFQAMVAAANVSQSSGEGSGGVSSDDAQATDTPPVIQVNGDNPAIMQVGDTYNDLGATITGPQADLNLGITTYVNGAAMSPVQIDTSAAATDTIDYVATDQNGLTSTSTRTVIIEAPSIVPSDTASTTTATTTDATTTAATTTAQ